MVNKKVFISTSSFGVENDQPLRLLEEQGIQYTLNPHGRKLTPDETASLLQGMHGVIAGTESYSRDVLDRLPSLQAISRCGAGTDGIDRDALATKNIALMSTPNVHVTAVAELTLAGLLALSRRIAQNNALMKSGKWEKLMGSNLSGKTVALIGFGRVGKQVATVLNELQCRVMAYDPYFADAFPPEVERVKHLNEVWSVADVISLHVPATDETRFLLRKETLQQCKPDVLIVNTARGELIREQDLLDFLTAHPEAGAYLDVYEKEPYSGPLTALNNVVVTPHVGTFTRETRVLMEIEAVQNIIHYFQTHG